MNTKGSAQEPVIAIDLPEPDLVAAYERAARQNVLAAVNDKVFFGYWSVCADGQGFGYGNTYPSLDGHQMTDALLWLNQVQTVKANWDYVRPFQMPNGHLPIAVLPGTRDVAGMPVDANGGLYTHWVPGDPLRALASPTYIQNADSIFRHTQDRDWLIAQLPSLNLAAEYLAGLTTPAGQVGGAGYYVERPPRIEYDGVTQCHAADAFQRVSVLNHSVGASHAAQRYAELARHIAEHFRRTFWVGDHFAEYIHPTRGIIASHGLTDVDWSALATGVANDAQRAALWPQLKDEQRFYYGGMPTGISTRPDTYEDWEFTVPDRHDLAAMGRVWYIECGARARLGDGDGLVDSLRRVCRAGRENGYYWRERYHPDGSAAGPNTYCEYPANLIRIVQRFLMGVELRLDGTVAIAPTVPARFWDAGFGQTLSWGEQSLSYRMERGRVAGTFVGPRPQRLALKLDTPDTAAAMQVTVDGHPVEPERLEGFTLFHLPRATTPCSFAVVRAQGH